MTPHNYFINKQITELTMQYPHFQNWYFNREDRRIDIHVPETYHLIGEFEGHLEFKAKLAELAAPLTESNKANDRGRLPRKECYRVLKYAKKWLGLDVPPNLSKLTLEQLRAEVVLAFGDDVPKFTEISYKGILAILRGLRVMGHKVTLKAKLPVLLAQVVELVPRWELNYHDLVESSESHQATIKVADKTLVTFFADFAPQPNKKGEVITTIIGRPKAAKMAA